MTPLHTMGTDVPRLGQVPGRRSFIARLWLLGSVAYGGLRALLVWRYLSGYGVNPWAFAAVELGSSAVYGWTSARLVIALVDRSWPVLRWLAPATLVAYAAPDVYVFATVGSLPDGLLRTVVGIVGVSFVVAVITLAREVLRARVGRASSGDGS